MSVHYIEKPDPFLKEIIKATFPDYTGRKIKLSTDIPAHLDSYWDGGSRDYYAFFRLSTKQAVEVHSNHPEFEAGRPRDLELLPQDIVLVRRSFFCGKDMGITIFANKCDLTPLLPPGTPLTEDEKIVLSYTKSLKSSYAGIKNYRFVEAHRKTGITLERWEDAKASLISTKCLNKRGAITPKGRNALEQ